jgi:hypothetical protein
MESNRKKNMNIKYIDNIMVQFSVTRLKNLGEREGGLYGYYSHRIKDNSIFSNDDIFIINYLFENYKDKRIHEFCAGAAQCSHCLSLMKIENISASDLDEKRYKYAVDLGLAVNSKCNIIKKKFQELNFSQYDLLFSVNAAGSINNIHEDINLFKKIIQFGCILIICPGLYTADDKANIDKKIVTDIIVSNNISYKPIDNFYILGE